MPSIHTLLTSYGCHKLSADTKKKVQSDYTQNNRGTDFLTVTSREEEDWIKRDGTSRYVYMYMFVCFLINNCGRGCGLGVCRSSYCATNSGPYTMRTMSGKFAIKHWCICYFLISIVIFLYWSNHKSQLTFQADHHPHPVLPVLSPEWNGTASKPNKQGLQGEFTTEITV